MSLILFFYTLFYTFLQQKTFEKLFRGALTWHLLIWRKMAFRSDTALTYNDRAVLENYHICQAFTLLKQDDCNILSGLSKDEYR